jgi:NAD(P)-dependent dehydrogenase (short-subunit alcohol dehydrogenase family)
MAGRVAGKLALVTGAAQGLGAAQARMLAREGARVLCSDINAAGATATAEAIDAECGAGTGFACALDVTIPEQWDAAIAEARDRLGGLSILVNNAGVGVRGNIETCTYEEWKRGFAINVDSVFLGCQKALPLMKEHQPGSIVNISSIAGLIASDTMPGYNASKAAVWMLSKSIALYCAKMGWNIRCNSVHPTFIDTPILDGMVAASGKEKAVVMDKLARQIPLKRVGEPDDIALGVLYLASDESKFMTGAELKLDGGISAM